MLMEVKKVLAFPKYLRFVCGSSIKLLSSTIVKDSFSQVWSDLTPAGHTITRAILKRIN